MLKNLNIYTIKGAIILDAAFNYAAYKNILINKKYPFFINKTWFTLSKIDAYDNPKSQLQTEIFKYIVFTSDGRANIDVSESNLMDSQIALYLNEFAKMYDRLATTTYDTLKTSIETRTTLNFKPYLKLFKMFKIKKSEILQLQNFYANRLKDEKVDFKLTGSPLNPFCSEVLNSILNILLEFCDFATSLRIMNKILSIYKMSMKEKDIHEINVEFQIEIKTLINLRNFILTNRRLPLHFDANILKKSEKRLNQFKNLDCV